MSESKRQLLAFERKDAQEMVDASRTFYETMKRRRSVREFSEEPVDRAVIENALLAAGTAPSGANMQPWHFVVVSDPLKKREIRLAAEKEEREFYTHRASEEWLEALEPLGTDERKPFLEEAPCLIVVFLQKFTHDDKRGRLKNYYTSESVGIACGMLLAALHLSGLATLTHTPSPMRFLNELLGRPADERAYMIIVVGYPKENTRVPVIAKKSLDQIATFIQGQ